MDGSRVHCGMTAMRGDRFVRGLPRCPADEPLQVSGNLHNAHPCHLVPAAVSRASVARLRHCTVCRGGEAVCRSRSARVLGFISRAGNPFRPTRGLPSIVAESHRNGAAIARYKKIRCYRDADAICVDTLACSRTSRRDCRHGNDVITKDMKWDLLQGCKTAAAANNPTMSFVRLPRLLNEGKE